MASTCTICNHEKIDQIDRLLAAGKTRKAVAAQFEVSLDAVRRHARNHPNPTVSVPPASSPGAGLRSHLEAQLARVAAQLERPDLSHKIQMDLLRESRLLSSEMLKHGFSGDGSADCPPLEETEEWIRFAVDLRRFFREAVPRGELVHRYEQMEAAHGFIPDPGPWRGVSPSYIGPENDLGKKGRDMVMRFPALAKWESAETKEEGNGGDKPE